MWCLHWQYKFSNGYFPLLSVLLINADGIIVGVDDGLVIILAVINVDDKLLLLIWFIMVDDDCCMSIDRLLLLAFLSITVLNSLLLIILFVNLRRLSQLLNESNWRKLLRFIATAFAESAAVCQTDNLLFWSTVVGCKIWLVVAGSSSEPEKKSKMFYILIHNEIEELTWKMLKFNTNNTNDLFLPVSMSLPFRELLFRCRHRNGDADGDNCWFYKWISLEKNIYIKHT